MALPLLPLPPPPPRKENPDDPPAAGAAGTATSPAVTIGAGVRNENPDDATATSATGAAGVAATLMPLQRGKDEIGKWRRVISLHCEDLVSPYPKNTHPNMPPAPGIGADDEAPACADGSADCSDAGCGWKPLTLTVLEAVGKLKKPPLGAAGWPPTAAAPEPGS